MRCDALLRYVCVKEHPTDPNFAVGGDQHEVSDEGSLGFSFNQLTERSIDRSIKQRDMSPNCVDISIHVQILNRHLSAHPSVDVFSLFTIFLLSMIDISYSISSQFMNWWASIFMIQVKLIWKFVKYLLKLNVINRDTWEKNSSPWHVRMIDIYGNYWYQIPKHPLIDNVDDQAIQCIGTSSFRSKLNECIYEFISSTPLIIFKHLRELFFRCNRTWFSPVLVPSPRIIS